MSPLHEVNLILFTRYLKILQRIEPNTQPDDPTSIQHLKKMCELAIRHPEMYIDKHSRWLGYVQGVLTMRGHIRVQEERDFTRPLYHDAYRRMGLERPKILEVYNEQDFVLGS